MASSLPPTRNASDISRKASISSAKVLSRASAEDMHASANSLVQVPAMAPVWRWENKKLTSVRRSAASSLSDLVETLKANQVWITDDRRVAQSSIRQHTRRRSPLST